MLFTSKPIKNCPMDSDAPQAFVYHLWGFWKVQQELKFILALLFKQC